MPTLLALNVANPTKERAKGLLEWLWHQGEDVLVLTEVGASEGSHLIESVCRAAGHATHRTSRKDLGVLVVDRAGGLSLDTTAPALTVRSERILPFTLSGLAVCGVYGAASDPVRYANKEQRQRKREWLAAYRAWLEGWLATRPRAMILGDLNVVDPLHDDRLPYVLAEERAFYNALGQDLDLVDAVRALHPQDRSPSWVDHSGVGCRYDHAFVTPDLVPRTTTALDHTPRLEGLTDHSALRITLR